MGNQTSSGKIQRLGILHGFKENPYWEQTIWQMEWLEKDLFVHAIYTQCALSLVRLCSHACAHVIRTHQPRPEIEKYALITFYRSVQMCTHTSSAIRVLHPPSALNRSLLDFWRVRTEADGR